MTTGESVEAQVLEPQAALVPESGTPAAGLRLARLGLAAGMISRLAGRLVGIVLVVVLARQADSTTVAVYGYLLGTATLVTTFTDLGVASVAGREVAAGRLPADGALFAALLPQLASVLAAALVTIGLTVFVGPATVPTTALALTVAFVLVAGMNNLWADVLRGTGRVVLEGSVQLAGAVLLVAAGALVIAGGGSATDLLVVVVLKEVAVFAVVACAVRPRRRAEVRTRALLGQSLWLAVASTAVVLLWRQGTLVMGGAGSIGALATYVVATRFFDAGVTVAHTFGFGLGPGMSALAADRAAFRAAARKYLGLAALLGVAVALVGGLLAGPITTLPFGARWESAVPAVRMVAISGLPILVGYVALTLLVARAQMRWMCGSAVSGSVAGVVATLLLTAARPVALSAVTGTAIGASVMAVLLVVGLRDLVLPDRADRAPRFSEQALSDYYAAFLDSGTSSSRYLLRHPLATVGSLVAISRLPMRRAVFSGGAGGRSLHLAMSRPGPFGTPLGSTGVALLDVPEDAAEYTLGASKQTLRRKARKAVKAGVTWRLVSDPAERLALLGMANAAEQAHADDQYRNEAPDNSDLLDHELWLGAFAADGAPLMLSVTPVDGEWGQLRYFRTLGPSQEASDARYLMTQMLVETLAARGVRQIVEGTHPAELSNGLRHFQRMVGFRLVRVSATLTTADSSPAAAPEPLAAVR